MAGAAHSPHPPSEGRTKDARVWSEKFRTLVNESPTIGAMAKYYTCTFLLDMEEARVLVAMRDGKVDQLTVNPGGLEPYDFAIRASADTWRKFTAPTPPPMYHGIWAATFRRDMKLEGNLTVMMQNLRNLTVQLELLRRIGVPV